MGSPGLCRCCVSRVGRLAKIHSLVSQRLTGRSGYFANSVKHNYTANRPFFFVLLTDAQSSCNINHLHVRVFMYLLRSCVLTSTQRALDSDFWQEKEPVNVHSLQPVATSSVIFLSLFLLLPSYVRNNRGTIGDIFLWGHFRAHDQELLFASSSVETSSLVLFRVLSVKPQSSPGSNHRDQDQVSWMSYNQNVQLDYLVVSWLVKYNAFKTSEKINQ